jgi:hypothetical protein
MTYPYVQAAFDYGARKGPALAFVVHMAEGAGTVGYLSRDPARGVSVHYVIETSGRIVQMLHEDRASGSINPNDLRTTNDADGFFGVKAAHAVLGSWASNPNAAVISLEIEGYASQGPNKAQHDALVRLVTDVRSRHPKIGLLGHRDFADYKACPGRRIDWASIGGHGPHIATPSTEDPVGLSIELLGTKDATPLDAFLTAKVKGADHVIFNVATGASTKVADGLDLGVVQRARLVGTLPGWADGNPAVVAFNYATAGLHIAVIRDVVTAGATCSAGRSRRTRCRHPRRDRDGLRTSPRGRHQGRWRRHRRTTEVRE